VCAQQVPLAPGETIAGQDPQTLLDPFFGSWHGTLAWADGAAPRQTQLTLTVSQNPNQPLYRASCPDSVYTYPTVSIVTDDGALDATISAIASSESPQIPNYQVASGLSLDGIPDWQWNGTVADRILGLDRYTDPLLVLDLGLKWNWAESKPVSGILNFTGTSLATGKLESFAIGAWTVD
jgi:hypothetical protein